MPDYEMIGMEFGTVQCTDSNYYKSVCVFTCNNGYMISGDSALTCSNSQPDEYDWNKPPPTCYEKCTTNRLDIALVIDSSSSVGNESFALVRKSLVRLINFFDVSFEETQFAAIRYNAKAYELWKFQQFDKKEDYVKLIEAMPYDGKGTRTANALNTASDLFFGGGDHGARADAVRIVLVLTDGNSKDDSTKAAKALHDRNVYVAVVGIGKDIDRGLLTEMASEPKEDFTLFIDDYSVLSSRTNTINAVLRQCKNVQCVPRTSVLDLVVMVDTSSSIGQENFLLVQDFLSNLFGNFPIGLDDTRIGLVAYNNFVDIKFFLNTFSSKRGIMEAIQNVTYEGVGTLTGQAMVETAQKLYDPVNGYRQNIPTVTVLITDGKSQDPVDNPAKFMHDLSRVIAVGIGLEADVEELQTIASGEGDENVFRVESFEALGAIHEILANSIASSCASLK